MATTTEAADIHHMRSALGLARRGLGNVWPNPAVGCVLVRDGRVIARGWTQPGGRPHAEAEALTRAGSAAHGATVYIGFEPCAHHGETPPCADALCAAGIARAVIAVEDPDPRTSGKGIARLRDAGIEVDLGQCAEAASELNAGFILRQRAGRPLVTLKVATTLDGRIATHTGESRWITGPVARRWSHMLRADHDAVMVGIGTALADDPKLDCRLAGLESRSPIRIVVDGRLRLALTSHVVVSAARAPTWLATLAGADRKRRAAFADCGVRLIEVAPDANGNPDAAALLAALGEAGLTRLLVEGGGHLAAALLRHGFVDRIVWFRAPRIAGGDGIPVAAAFGVETLADMPSFTRIAAIEADGDFMETYRRAP